MPPTLVLVGFALMAGGVVAVLWVTLMPPPRPAGPDRQPPPVAFVRAIGLIEILVGLVLVATGYLNS